MIRSVAVFGIFEILCALMACESLAGTSGGVKSPGTAGVQMAQIKASGVLSKPDGKGPFPAVVLLHSCGGFGSHVKETWPRFLNGLGYVTYAVDSFGPHGRTRCSGAWVRDPDAKLVRSKEAYAGLGHLAKQPFVDANRVAVIGFSLGAITIKDFATWGMKSKGGRDFKAGVMMYGACVNLVPKSGMIPLLVINGDRETKLFVGTCRALKGKPGVSVHVLKNTAHAFDREQFTRTRYDLANNPMLYSAKATKKARALIKAFLAQHVGR